MNVFRVQRKIGWLLSKLKCFFVCVILIVSFFSVSGQGKRVSLRMENVSFMEILTQIERLTDYSFVFKMEDVEKITHLTIQMEDKTVKEVLDACLKDTGLKYLLENNLIIIKKETVQVHPVVISGVVKDVHGETIPGVTVLIKGTGYGTVTDDNGVFKAEFYGGENVVLKFSFIGMKSKELVYSGQKDIEVSLEEDVAVMNEGPQNSQCHPIRCFQ